MCILTQSIIIAKNQSTFKKIKQHFFALNWDFSAVWEIPQKATCFKPSDNKRHCQILQVLAWLYHRHAEPKIKVLEKSFLSSKMAPTNAPFPPISVIWAWTAPTITWLQIIAQTGVQTAVTLIKSAKSFFMMAQFGQKRRWLSGISFATMPMTRRILTHCIWPEWRFRWSLWGPFLIIMAVRGPVYGVRYLMSNSKRWKLYLTFELW